MNLSALSEKEKAKRGHSLSFLRRQESSVVRCPTKDAGLLPAQERH